MLLLTGGDTWMEKKNNNIKPIVEYAFEHNIPVAAIRSATFFIGENGYLDKRKHTSNTLEFAKEIMLYLKTKPADEPWKGYLSLITR